jgi:hypothetical protein
MSVTCVNSFCGCNNHVIVPVIPPCMTLTREWSTSYSVVSLVPKKCTFTILYSHWKSLPPLGSCSISSTAIRFEHSFNKLSGSHMYLKTACTGALTVILLLILLWPSPFAAPYSRVTVSFLYYVSSYDIKGQLYSMTFGRNDLFILSVEI